MTRFLAERGYTLEELRRSVKGPVRKIKSDLGGGLLFDDTIHKKAWTDERELICRDFDRVAGRTIKGIHLINVLYSNRALCCIESETHRRQWPLAWEKEPLQLHDMKTRQVKCATEVTNNERMRSVVAACLSNQLKPRYALLGSGYASSESFACIDKKR